MIGGPVPAVVPPEGGQRIAPPDGGHAAVI